MGKLLVEYIVADSYKEPLIVEYNKKPKRLPREGNTRTIVNTQPDIGRNEKVRLNDGTVVKFKRTAQYRYGVRAHTGLRDGTSESPAADAAD